MCRASKIHVVPKIQDKRNHANRIYVEDLRFQIRYTKHTEIIIACVRNEEYLATKTVLPLFGIDKFYMYWLSRFWNELIKFRPSTRCFVSVAVLRPAKR